MRLGQRLGLPADLPLNRLSASQYIGANSYLEQQDSTKYNGTSSVRATFGWYPMVGWPRLPFPPLIGARVTTRRNLVP
jgi:hypothetical protein